MKIYETESLTPASMPANETEKLWLYNGLDCCITHEVLSKITQFVRPETQAVYDFSRQLQGPILEMNTRGVLIDEVRRQSLLEAYRKEMYFLSDQLGRIIRDGLGFQYEIPATRKNPWPSAAQLCTLFYDYMQLPTKYKVGDEGQRSPTVDRNALEKIEEYFYAEPIVRHILTLRELGKRISFLSTSVDSDGRLRTSFNIAGTTTGRLASSFSDFGTGTNLQNVENRLRTIFIADPGYKFGNIDLEQSDSRAVGAIHWNLFRDDRYLSACESGDLHTTVAQSAFTNVVWASTLADNRRIANGRFYREFTYRDAAKRLGHGTNDQGEPPKMARATHIPKGDIEQFQHRYLAAFPAFQQWWEWVANQLIATGRITTFLGRPRRFFGHPKDPDTVRAAIAFEPQSVTADTINRGLLALWRENIVQPLLQVHDSILFQFKEEDEDWIIPKALSFVQQVVRLKGDRDFVIPAEAKVGWSWTDDPNEPNGMRKWPEKDNRKRVS